MFSFYCSESFDAWTRQNYPASHESAQLSFTARLRKRSAVNRDPNGHEDVLVIEAGKCVILSVSLREGVSNFCQFSLLWCIYLLL